MDEMNEERWRKLNKELFDEIRDMLDRLEDGLRKEEGLVAYNFMKPIRYMLFEANRDVIQNMWKRRENGGDILKSIIGKENGI